ncbi:hypothetical protein GCM10010466_23530 [Planomonospora alba]|uniref:Uncharacterized protein n=1 Tax=Planomonospora alba TaxID=161354 RepID=A0ABP6N048_9ACTN
MKRSPEPPEVSAWAGAGTAAAARAVTAAATKVRRRSLCTGFSTVRGMLSETTYRKLSFKFSRIVGPRDRPVNGVPEIPLMRPYRAPPRARQT